MIFNSYTFILFFLIVLGLHHLSFSWPAKKFNLLIASYAFYAAWNPPFVILLWLSTMVDWYAAKGVARSQKSEVGLPRRSCITKPGGRNSKVGSQRSEVRGRNDQGIRTKNQGIDRPVWKARGWLVLSLCVNLGLLGFFKYGNFLLENFVWLVNQVGIDYHPAKADIILPVGISFYTFQTMSYTLDVYRRKLEVGESFLDFALYVTFFPQLVAGPIVRAADFLPQCLKEYRATAAQFNWGLSLLILGLFEKVVVADLFLAPVVDLVYGTSQIPNPASAWLGTLAFAGQIFCDFAGYSTCAIGVAMCLGFALPDNFRFPYAAIGFSDFWGRWHISLSSWLRDYLYIPLGGNRKGRGWTYANLATTMLLGGLWHGASWTFVAWGGLHGSYLIVERWLREHVVALQKIPKAVALPVAAIVTFFLVNVTWVFFRAESFGQAFAIVRAMLLLGQPGTNLIKEGRFVALGIVSLLVGTHWIMRTTSLEAMAARVPWPLRSVILGLLLFAIMLSSGENRAFIYFQF